MARILVTGTAGLLLGCGDGGPMASDVELEGSELSEADDVGSDAGEGDVDDGGDAFHEDAATDVDGMPADSDVVDDTVSDAGEDGSDALDGSLPCDLDFDCPVGQACLDGSCVEVSPDGTCFEVFDRPMRRRQLTDYWTEGDRERPIFTGTGRCGEHCLVAGVLHPAPAPGGGYLYKLTREGGSAAPVPSPGFSVLATTATGGADVWVAWKDPDVERLRLDRLAGSSLLSGDSFPLADFAGAPDMGSLHSGWFDSAPGSALHLFVEGASRGLFAELVLGSGGHFAITSAERDPRTSATTPWRRFAAALRPEPPGGKEVIGVLGLTSGSGTIERFDPATIDPFTAEDIGSGVAPQVCRTPDGDLVVGYVRQEVDALVVEFARLQPGSPQTAYLPPFRAPAGLADREVATGLFLLSCAESEVTFALIPTRCLITIPDARWGIYAWDGTTDRRLSIEPPSVGVWNADFYSGFWSGAAWEEPCQGVRLVVPWEGGSPARVLEYLEL